MKLPCEVFSFSFLLLNIAVALAFVACRRFYVLFRTHSFLGRSLHPHSFVLPSAHQSFPLSLRIGKISLSRKTSRQSFIRKTLTASRIFSTILSPTCGWPFFLTFTQILSVTEDLRYQKLLFSYGRAYSNITTTGPLKFTTTNRLSLSKTSRNVPSLTHLRTLKQVCEQLRCGHHYLHTFWLSFSCHNLLLPGT
jgi:hypothetical protein